MSAGGGAGGGGGGGGDGGGGSIPMFEPVCFLALRQHRPGNTIIPQRCRHILGDTKPITLIYGALADIYTPLNWREENGATNANLDCRKEVSFRRPRRGCGTLMEETGFELTAGERNSCNASPLRRI